MNRKLVLSVCALAGACLSTDALGAGSDSDRASELRWHFDRGKVLTYCIEQTTRIGQALTSTLVYQTVWTVDKVHDAGAELTVTIPRIEFAAKGNVNGPLRVDYDSDHKLATAEGVSAQALFDQFDALRQRPLRMTITARGEVSKLDLPRETKEIFFRYRELGGFFGEAVTEIGLRRVLEQTVLTLPQEPVSAGDQWQDAYKLTFGDFLDVSGDSTYTDRGSLQDQPCCRKIAVKTVETWTFSPPDAKQRTRSHQTTVTGTAEFDRRAGHLTRSSSTQTGGIELTTRIRLQPEDRQEQKR